MCSETHCRENLQWLLQLTTVSIKEVVEFFFGISVMKVSFTSEIIAITLRKKHEENVPLLFPQYSFIVEAH